MGVFIRELLRAWKGGLRAARPHTLFQASTPRDCYIFIFQWFVRAGRSRPSVVGLIMGIWVMKLHISIGNYIEIKQKISFKMGQKDESVKSGGGKTDEVLSYATSHGG